MKRFPLAAAVVLLAAFAAAPPAAAKVRFFMEVFGPTIEGESKVSGYEKWIEVQAFAQQVSNPSGGDPAFEPVRVLKELDRASVEISYRTAVGSHFDQVTIEAVQVGKELAAPVPLYRLSLQNCRFLDIAPTGDGPSLTEALSIGEYTRVTWTYYRYNNKGNIAETVTKSWPP